MTQSRDSSSEIFALFDEIGTFNQLFTEMLVDSLPDGVHPSHFAILNHLVQHSDGLSPARIAKAMQVTRNTMTHSLKVLQGRHFITVGPDPSDGRGKLVHLTIAGRSFLIKAMANVQATFGVIVGLDERARMVSLLHDLHALRSHFLENRRV